MTNNIAMLRQPSGTNHFQLRFHQFGFGVGGIADVICSTNVFYFECDALCNGFLRAVVHA
jgi:hypothetical protein